MPELNLPQNLINLLLGILIQRIYVSPYSIFEHKWILGNTAKLPPKLPTAHRFRVSAVDKVGWFALSFHESVQRLYESGFAWACSAYDRYFLALLDLDVDVMQGDSPAEFDSKLADIYDVFSPPDAWCTANLLVFFIIVGFRVALDVSRFFLGKLVHTFDASKGCADEDGVGRDPVDEIIDVCHYHKGIDQHSNIAVCELLDCEKYHAHLYDDIDIAVEREVARKSFMLAYSGFHGVEQQFFNMSAEMVLQVVNFYLLYTFNCRWKTILNGTAFALTTDPPLLQDHRAALIMHKVNLNRHEKHKHQEDNVDRGEKNYSHKTLEYHHHLPIYVLH